MDYHELYTKYQRSFLNVTCSRFIVESAQLQLCNGIQTPDPVKALDFQKHCVPKSFDYFTYQTSAKAKLHQVEFNRSQSCSLLVPDVTQPCRNCKCLNVRVMSEINRKKVNLEAPVKLKAPIKFTSSEKVKLTLQQHRLENIQLHSQIDKMKSALENCSQKFNPELNNDLISIFSGTDQQKIPPFMKLFWKEQQRYLKCSTSSTIRYHPIIIKYCLSLVAKSQSAYTDLRYDSKTGSGVLILPSSRTLRDYKNYIRPTRGFNPDVITDLAKKTTKNFMLHERFVTIFIDEMKIQEDLIWDKYSGELIGFVDLGDCDINAATLVKPAELATHVLVFMVKSIVNPLSIRLATFATTGVFSFQLMPIFWTAVHYLEKINLKVISATADSASPNRKFFVIHKFMDGDAGKNVVYRAQNIYANDKRFIYFL